MRWDEMGESPGWDRSVSRDASVDGGTARGGRSSVLAVVAEKPAVARDIARVLGANERGEGFLRGNGYVVTWAIGHLVGLAQPHEIRPEWKKWHRSQLPMLPGDWPLVVSDSTKAQFEVVRRVMNAPEVSAVVCATDAGREGELIFRYIYDAAGCRKPVRRLWVSSLTERAIRDGFQHLKDGKAYAPLAAAAMGRSRADWLVGMNLSRLYTLASGTYGNMLSVGRVQTPTLAMVVERELAIRDFVPRDYLEVVATFSPRGKGAPVGVRYQGTWFRSGPDGKPVIPPGYESVREARRLDADGVEAGRVIDRVRGGNAVVESLDAETKRMAPPLLYDLTELQRHANRLYGFSAQRTLEVAQALYEKHKLLSYPRTASRHLSETVADTLPEVVRAIEAPYREDLAPGTGERPLGKRYVDDSKVTDHHAIIPTPMPASGVRLSPDEQRLYDLVCRRLLQAWHEDHVWKVTTVITAVTSKGDAGPVVDRFHSAGTQVEKVGWKVLDVGGGQKAPRLKPEGKKGADKDKEEEPDDEPQDLPSGLARGQAQTVEDVEAVKKRTRPPPRFTEATLLTAMESAGRTLDEKELVDAMRDTGLGTPATRAATIELLLEREYLTREGKRLVATDKGIHLIQVVHPDVKSPVMTGQWEAWLQRIERGQGALDAFMSGIEAYVREVVGQAPTSLPPTPVAGPGARNEAAASSARFESTRPHPAKAPTEDLFRTREAATATVQAAARANTARNEVGASASMAGDGSRAFGHGATGDARHAGASTHGGSDGHGGAVAQAAPPRVQDRPPNIPSAEVRTAFVQASSEGFGRAKRQPQTVNMGSTRPERVHRAPTPPDKLRGLLKEAFGFNDFRPYQEEVCRAATSGEDLLLVMPTGAGKSLCYQLPGLARAGTTVVVSPLIALMEDQVLRLQSLGFAADRIHSGRDRATSRQVCAEYLEGRLDFLFIAPERLGVPGFVELLARRTPSLIAIDEAHCISQWGHDFRPDYRLLGSRLPLLRPAPVVALTATATPDVQKDIVQQLGLRGSRGGAAHTFIHGFRRTNIAIEVRELNPGARGDAILSLLKNPEHRPAIVYASTRKHAEQYADLLAHDFHSAPYHAGLQPSERDRIQAAFLKGHLEVIVATTAFGMGIDKPDVRTVIHAALPASLEGYYQELGRAGRDGKDSRAVLLHAFVDRRTHEFFHRRDYPDPSVLERIYQATSNELEPKASIQARVRGDPEIFDKALEQLWIHGGVEMTPDEDVRRGRAGWAVAYIAQRERKQLHLEQMGRYAEAHDCRMRHLVAHFGDVQDSGAACGLCDVCAPESCEVVRFEEPSALEAHALGRILEALHARDGQATGRLHRELFGEQLHRRDFERLVGGLVRAGLVRLESDSFDKDGQVIQFQRLALTDTGRRARVIAPGQVVLPQAREVPSKKRKGRTAAGGTKRASRKRAASSAEGASRGRGKSRRGASESWAPRAASDDFSQESFPTEAPPARGWKARATPESSPGRGPRASWNASRNAAPDFDPPPASPALVATLKEWRLTEARKRKVPAFRILTDRVLDAIASARPSSGAELMSIHGVGPTLAERYGPQILSLVSRRR
ncbi:MULTISPECIES: DNA topoisomerase 3 [unclassified Corallococcus]|uniref:DNA topoisomerase 3 n=1 Tax=unclassified Corallococcus TaxID=2685029 RepID=UPI001A905F8A|nr:MULTISPECIES: DNA topoisomerase 3 [unclassified Corallococcus]MBN9680922.1 DNA topoisomerase 3 [Corallococcus sp. NCSPR001]WAS87480.1 DNA topoisomerase 3 [Corallococcus sp. NCRR]